MNVYGGVWQFNQPRSFAELSAIALGLSQLYQIHLRDDAGTGSKVKNTVLWAKYIQDSGSSTWRELSTA